MRFSRDDDWNRCRFAVEEIRPTRRPRFGSYFRLAVLDLVVSVELVDSKGRTVLVIDVEPNTLVRRG